MAEFLAMILFIVISIGSALGFQYPLKNNQTSGASQDNVKVSLAFGLSIATLAQSVGHISGAHLNPAVTLGLLLSCQISILRALMYIVAQCVGAIVATAILSGITSSLPGNSLGRNDVSGAGDWRIGGLEGDMPAYLFFPLAMQIGTPRTAWGTGTQPELRAVSCEGSGGPSARNSSIQPLFQGAPSHGHKLLGREYAGSCQGSETPNSALSCSQILPAVVNLGKLCQASG